MIMILTLIAAQLSTPLLIDRKPAERPELLILGSPHLANNNRDIANTHVEDVTVPARQREIEAMVTSLARFKPTRIAIEWPSNDQAGLDTRYADYRAGTLKVSANERDQIALRLAAQLGLARVDAIDWNEEPPGVDADYDFGAWAKSHGQSDRVEALRTHGQAEADMTAVRMRCTPVADWYRALNSTAALETLNRIYYDYALIGDGVTDPGAVWVGNWHMRNLRIFGDLVRRSNAGDRVLVLYGAGHAYLLDRFARESGAFRLADPLAWLPKASAKRC